MFDQLMKCSNRVWIYRMGRFAEERRAFLCDLNGKGHSLRTLRSINKLLVGIAERVNVRRAGEVTEAQIVRAAKDCAGKSFAPTSKPETHEAATKRFDYWTKNWLRFLGKWRDPIRNPRVRPKLDSFLKDLRDERGYTNQTITTRESALNLFFVWKQPPCRLSDSLPSGCLDFPTPLSPLSATLPPLKPITSWHSNPIAHRVRRKHQRLPPSLLS